jgi:hypothetical protein
MIIDGLLLFSTAQNVTTSDNVSTNVIDMISFQDIGPGGWPRLRVAAYVTTTFATTDAGTLTIQLQCSTDNSTYTTIAYSPAYAAAALVAGAKLAPFDWPPLPPGVALPRYLRLNYAVGSLHFTPGSVTSMLVLDREDILAYPPGIGITN